MKAGYEASLARENELKDRIQVLKRDVLDLQNCSIQYNILKREVDTNRELYASLLQRFKEVDVAGGVGTNNVFVVDKAEFPGAPSSPNLSRALLLALMFGVAAGCATAYGLEFLDNRVRSIEQVESIAGLPVLGVQFQSLMTSWESSPILDLRGGRRLPPPFVRACGSRQRMACQRRC